MGLIINIDEALNNRTDYNLLREPINDMLRARQEAWEVKNPIDLLFVRGKIDKFQQLYTSSIGFAHAFAETSDYAAAPIFNTHEGFSKVYTSRTFQGGFIISQQVLEDGAYSSVKDTASRFMTRWHGDLVEYAMKAIASGFGKEVTFGDATNGGVSKLKLTSADTMTAAQAAAAIQANSFYVDDGTTKGIDLTGNDPGKVAKLADVINQVITIMEYYKDDNGKYAGVNGAKRIVAPNDARLHAMLNSAIELDMFKETGLNPAYKRATVETTPYLRDIDACFKDGKAVGFFIVDPAYNAENHGPEFTERIALTMNVENKKNPYGIGYDARQRFDINVASWRGIAYVYIGATAPDVAAPVLQAAGTTADKTGFDAMQAITPIATVVKPVSVVGTVTTKQGT